MLKFRKVLTAGAVLLLTAVGFTTQANAVPVAPGGGLVALPGTTAAARSDLSGIVVADVIRPFSVNTPTAKASGWVQDRVVKTKDGTLDFYYRVHVDEGSTAAISLISRSSFAPTWTPTDVDWRLDGLGLKNPDTASRGGNGWWVYVGYYGQNAIHAGEDSRFVFVKTRAKQYGVGILSLGYSDSSIGGTISIPGFQPIY